MGFHDVKPVLAVVCSCVLLCCREPTQITARITTDVACSDNGGAAVAVGLIGSLGDKPPSATVDPCLQEPGRELGDIVLIPSAGKDDEVAIQVVMGFTAPVEECLGGQFDTRCIVARRALRYIPHTELVVPIVMRAVCAGVECLPNETCVKGQCYSASIEPEQCRGDGCEEDKIVAAAAEDVTPVVREPDVSGGGAPSGEVPAPEAGAPSSAGGSDSGGAPPVIDECAEWGKTLSITNEPQDTVPGIAVTLTFTPEPDAAAHRVEVVEPSDPDTPIFEMMADNSASFAPDKAGEFVFRVIAERAGCPALTLTSRTLAACTQFWSVQNDALPLNLDDRALALASDVVVTLSGSGQGALAFSSLQGDGSLGAWTAPPMSALGGKLAFSMTGVAVAGAPFGPNGTGNARFWIIGGLGGATVPWVRAFDLTGPGSLMQPPVVLSSKTDLPTAAESGAALVVGDWLYYVGGNRGAILDEVARIRFDTTTGEFVDAWQIDDGVLPHGFDNLAAVATSERMYVAGGNDGTRRPTVLRGNVTLANGAVSFTQQAPLPEARDNAALAIDELGGVAYVVGGNNVAGNPTASVYRAEIAADGSITEWQTLPPLPAPLRQHEAVYAGGRLHVLGANLGGQQRHVRTLRLDGPEASARCP